MISNDRRDGHDPPAECLAEQVDVGNDILVLAGQCAAGPPEPGLDLVGDEQHLVAGAEFADPGQVAGRRDEHARLALDGFDQHRDDVVGDRVAQRFQVAVGDADEAGRVRSVMIMGDRVVGEADDRRGSTVEVSPGDDDLRLAVRHSLDLVAPFAGDLDARLDGLGTGVHRQHHLLADQGRQPLGERRESIMVEGARGQCHPLQLLAGSREQDGCPWPKFVAEYAARKSRYSAP